MWPNNGFENNGNNLNQDRYPSPFGGISGQQYLPQPPFQPSMMQFETSNGEGLMNGEFRPDIGLYNEGVLATDHFVNPANTKFPREPPHFNNFPTANTAPPSRPITNISSRAAELKAQLLKQRERASSATPPVSIFGHLGRQQPGTADGSSSLRESPQTLAKTTETSNHDLNISELIFQFSNPKPPADTQLKDDNNSLPAQQHPSLPENSAKSQASSSGSPTKIIEPDNGTLVGNGVNTKNLESSHDSSGSVSEGEILEDHTVEKPLPPARELKATKPIAKHINKEEPAPRNRRDEPPSKTSSGPRDRSPHRNLPYHSRPQSRHGEDRGDEADPSKDRRLYPSNYTNEPRPYPSDSNRSPHQHRDVRDQNEDRVEKHANVRSKATATLEELLSHDEDLKEWLQITGYHNEEYRNKVLSRRRAIAALDAQKNALLAEIEAEERGSIIALIGISSTSATMLPPQTPNKAAEDRIEPAPKSATTISDTQLDRVVSSKRPHSESRDIREESNAKVARTNDRGSRIKQDDDDYGRPRSSEYDPSRRRSYDDRRDARDFAQGRYDEGRGGRGRGSSRERDNSPRRKASESQPPARSRRYDGDDFHMRDRDDWEDRERDRSGERSERGQFVVRGGYRGRAYDPNYRGRGRGGRGRGNSQSQSHPELKAEPGSFGARIANGKPYKDTAGFDRGGKGDTRYFIVKSFNQENVIKCIEDGIWTTQLQNGPLFKVAFETCKNVILVFSINKSKAFQGYARMESLPESVETPSWQRAIHWESAGAFRVKWLVMCTTRFRRVGHLKNTLNEGQAVLIGKDGQEIEENCGRGLIELIDEEADQALATERRYQRRESWDG